MSNKHSILNRATKFLLPCVGAAALLVGCDSGSGGTLNGPQSDIYAASFDELPNCSANREGETATVESEKAIYQCVGGRWEYESPLPESNSSAGEYGELLDTRDGQVYRTVKIGDQVWMAQNLNYEYNHGTAKSYCYNDEADSCAKYGRLYLWSAAMDSAGAFSTSGKGCGYGETCSPSGTIRGVCPEGWHLPSKEEWETLFRHIVGVGEEICDDYRCWFVYPNIGEKLKSTSGWNSSGNGDDTYGFSVLPAGFFHGVFEAAGNEACFWSSSENDSDNAYDMYLDYLNEGAYMYDSYEGAAFSVRCVRN